MMLFKCEICEKEFVSAGTLIRHNSKVHPGKFCLKVIQNTCQLASSSSSIIGRGGSFTDSYVWSSPVCFL